MIVLNDGRKLTQDLATHNSFDYRGYTPLIVVLRRSRFTESGELQYVKDNGKNNCDSVLLVDNEQCLCLEGRSFPHDRYQYKMVEGIAKANYIASSYITDAWRKGPHRGKEALVQNKSFTIFRSSDMELGNEDDYAERDIVADNLHGNAPYSAGCVTVSGKMGMDAQGNEIRTGDWKHAYNWLYNTHTNRTFFSAMILGFSDVISLYDTNDWRLRIGSTGDKVAELQHELGIKDDGDFGPTTFGAVRKLQREYSILESGIYDLHTRKTISGEM